MNDPLPPMDDQLPPELAGLLGGNSTTGNSNGRGLNDSDDFDPASLLSAPLFNDSHGSLGLSQNLDIPGITSSTDPVPISEESSSASSNSTNLHQQLYNQQFPGTQSLQEFQKQSQEMEQQIQQLQQQIQATQLQSSQQNNMMNIGSSLSGNNARSPGRSPSLPNGRNPPARTSSMPSKRMQRPNLENPNPQIQSMGMNLNGIDTSGLGGNFSGMNGDNFSSMNGDNFSGMNGDNFSGMNGDNFSGMNGDNFSVMSGDMQNGNLQSNMGNFRSQPMDNNSMRSVASVPMGLMGQRQPQHQQLQNMGGMAQRNSLPVGGHQPMGNDSSSGRNPHASRSPNGLLGAGSFDPTNGRQYGNSDTPAQPTPEIMGEAMEKLCESMRRSAMSRSLVKQLSGRSLTQQNSARNLMAKQGSQRNLSRQNSGLGLRKQLSGRNLVRANSGRQLTRTPSGRQLLDGDGGGRATPMPVRRLAQDPKHRIQRDAVSSGSGPPGRGIFRHKSQPALMGPRNRTILQIDDNELGAF